jgi:hypothetical protein
VESGYTYAGNNAANMTDPSGECSVSVGLRKVSDVPLITAYHAYIVTADPITGEKSLFEGGKSDGRLRASGAKGAFGDGLSQRAYRGGKKVRNVYNDAGSCDRIVGQLEAVRNTINEGDSAYHFPWFNSNSVAREFLESLGLPIEKPGGWAPGWGHDVTGGRARQPGPVTIEPLR